jgi:hypothetical protein
MRRSVASAPEILRALLFWFRRNVAPLISCDILLTADFGPLARLHAPGLAMI